MNEDLSSYESLREAVTGRGTLDLWHLRLIHGPEVFQTFIHAWMKWEAVDKRSYVLFGMPNGRAKPPEIGDVESFYRMLRHAYADDSLTTWDNQPISAEKRMAEMGRWLLEQATPGQIEILKKYRAGEITFQQKTENEPLANLLRKFFNLVEELERLPSRDEFKERLFKKKSEGKVLLNSETSKFWGWLKLLGLDGLPETYSCRYEWPLESDLDGPFDAYRSSS